MAFIQVTLMSQALMRTVNVNVILPTDKMVFPGMPERGDKPYKTLYLLHGVFGSYIDWVNGTRIQRFAEENDLAVVMPSGENMFYLDQPASHNLYGEFIGKELVEQTRKMFPLSHKREDTFIGGLSMGGYGALRNGLKYAETFGSIVALSSALVYKNAAERTNDTPFFLERRDYAESFFGDLDKLIGSDKDPEALARKLVEEKKEVPAIYMACGLSDSLMPLNDEFAENLTAMGIPVTYKKGPGAHEWDFWDTYVRDAIENWLPTEKNGAGLSSGNVGI